MNVTIRPATTMAQSLKRLSSNLHSSTDIQESLDQLFELNAPLTLLRQYKIKMLATRYIMHPTAKDAARRLVAICNRLEKSVVAPSTTIANGISRKRPNTDAIEHLISCKRTTPIVSAPKSKSPTATKEGPSQRYQSISTQTNSDEQKKREERMARDFQRRKAVEAARMKDSEEKRHQQLMAIKEYKQQRLQAIRFGGSDTKENQKPIKRKANHGNRFKCRF
ncbi:hypothetical protein B9Z55_024734 [Caenorhabditis nigoni]|uniref:Uncharacterized protein n=1 Tax=Caenorhabditis nigoni TaxID=1611254 RepID=A0A2G5SW56_9PELO|nr:hypothetical protein B9Z55_024734 [Caenorhabditis nigoni]